MANQIAEKLENYIIIGVEKVEDENYEIVCTKPCLPVTIKALSLEKAIEKGEKVLQNQINTYRKKRGDASKGMFIAKVTEVKDTRGNIIYSN